MSLTNACQSLRSASRPARDALRPVAPVDALSELLAYGANRPLETDHPWELAARVCRDLETATDRVPVGGWAKLAGLAAGTGLLRAGHDAFEPLADGSLALLRDGAVSRPLVEAFTRRLIPPAAAAALYVALDVHPLWGLRLGREVGSTRVELAESLDMLGSGGLAHIQSLVFGTLSSLIVTLRDLDDGLVYPMDALGEVLWWSAKQARELAPPSRGTKVPVLVDRGERELRMMTTRLAIADLIDYVFAPAGVARRDDSGWVRFDPSALAGVVVGDFNPDEQVERFAELCHVGAYVC